ncbi:hypothetical protein K503DRAFT_725833 [Rhizopogon vinicolor AM-OR11-026]|uniref:CLASP N-terminal domain-containing protein n=1 Tax=Rhizopogon vinicolor AM-OR11-026 TaxID=1314800 RepID=A0A1B7MLF0_9AGAM|nr:hypothetical protein K503DRAFT_725833 [Rhizopogon vinicolor AM-OR11-026]
MPSRMISLPSFLTRELQDICKRVSIPETEESWDKIEQAIVQLTECCNISGCKFPEEMIAGIRSMSRPLNHAMKSERSRLSGSAIECVTAQSAGLGPLFEPLIPLFIPTLLGICARSNKVFTRRAKACIFAVITHTSSPSILPFLAQSFNSQSTSLRLVAAEGVLTYVKSSDTPIIANDGRARLVENVIRVTAEDASADIRTTGKALFEAYKARLPDCVASFIESLNPVIRKRLRATASESTSQVLSSGHTTTGTIRPVGSIHPQKSSAGKHPQREANPLNSQLSRDVRAVRPITLSKKVTSARQGTSAPVPSSTQSGKDVAYPLVLAVPTTSVTTKTNHTRAAAATIRPSSQTAPLPMAKAEHPTTRATSSRIPQLRSRGHSTEVKVQTTSQTSRIASRSSKEAVPQRKAVLGGGPVTKGMKPVVKAPSIRSTLCGMGNPGTGKPTLAGLPVTEGPKPVVKAPPVRSNMETRKAVPEDRPLPPDHAPWYPRRQRDFFTSTPRTSFSSLLSPPEIHGAESIAHTHTPNSSKVTCLEGCKLRDALYWSLDDVSYVEASSVRVENPRAYKPTLEGIPLSPDAVWPPAVPLASSIIRTPHRRRKLELVQATHDVLVPQDVNRPSQLCRLRRVPWRPRRQRPFITSTPRTSLSSPLLPPDISGAEVIAHTHSLNSNACFGGCKLRQALDWLDMDKAAMFFS